LKMSEIETKDPLEELLIKMNNEYSSQLILKSDDAPVEEVIVPAPEEIKINPPAADEIKKSDPPAAEEVKKSDPPASNEVKIDALFKMSDLKPEDEVKSIESFAEEIKESDPPIEEAKPQPAEEVDYKTILKIIQEKENLLFKEHLETLEKS